VQIEVYLNDDMNSLEFHSLLQTMRGLPEVQGVEYRSKQEALAQLESYLETDLSKGLDYSPLPASFLISLKREQRRFDTVARVASVIKKLEGVEDVEFGGSWLRKLDRTVYRLLIVGVIFGISLALAVVMVVANLTGAAVRLRSESVRIMSLLGASRADISLPIMIQGFFSGGLGALLGMLSLWVGYSVFISQFPAARFLPLSLVLGMVAWGMALGAGGSLVSGRRLLRAGR
jgi:cell division transport system permease protein